MLNSYAILIVDCQTTGASPSSSSLLELACNDRSWIIKQNQEIPQKILRLVGIKSEEIERGVDSTEVFAELLALINQSRAEFGDRVFAVAHFSRIEQVYLDRLWLANGEEKFPLPIVCTHKIAKLLYPRLPNYGLRALAGWFGMPLEEGKRAMNHVDATKQIWEALMVELEKKGIKSLSQLKEFLDQKPVRSAGRRDFLITREKRLGLPSSPGIYKYIDRSGRILYVGKATSLKSRVNSYFTGGCRGDHRKLEMLAQAVEVEVTPTDAPLYAGLLEYDEIRRLKPPYNIAFKGRGREPLKALTLLAGTSDAFDPTLHTQVIKEHFYELGDMNILCDGINLWRQQSFLSPQQLLTERNLLNMGVPLLRQWIAEEKERRLNRSDDAECDGVDDVEEGADLAAEEVLSWTPEMVADHCRRIIRRATRHYIRSKWLTRLSRATIELNLIGKAPGKRQKNPVMLTIPPHSDDDELDLRRMRVLLHELRRAESKGGRWKVTQPWKMTVPFWI